MTQADVTPPAPAPVPPPAAPPPPPGPGVLAPFPVPPTEGKRLRIGIGLGVGAAVVLLVCGGGLAASIGLTAVMSNALDEQAQVVVGDYLEDLEAKRYAEAYDQLCAPERARTTEAEFTSRVASEEPITSWQVGEVSLTDLGVPVDVTYANGDTARLQATLGQNPDTGQFQVCSLSE
jgi:hypothetical protein